LSKYYLRIQSVPQREHHTLPLQRSSSLMLFKEVIAVYSENYTRPINTKYRVTDFFKAAGTNTNHLTLKGYLAKLSVILIY
jgi:hypothetical protein